MSCCRSVMTTTTTDKLCTVKLPSWTGTLRVNGSPPLRCRFLYTLFICQKNLPPSAAADAATFCTLYRHHNIEFIASTCTYAGPQTSCLVIIICCGWIGSLPSPYNKYILNYVKGRRVLDSASRTHFYN